MLNHVLGHVSIRVDLFEKEFQIGLCVHPVNAIVHHLNVSEFDRLADALIDARIDQFLEYFFIPKVDEQNVVSGGLLELEPRLFSECGDDHCI
jgi:hypothetical protein